LIKTCNYEKMMGKFDYALMIFRESLRIEAPVVFSIAHECTRNVVLARGTDKELKIDAGHDIHIMFTQLHHDETEWGPEHDDFIPERFDSKSKYFVRPDGKARNPYSFVPFLGGHRVCLGKTMAEIKAKTLLVIITKCYELEHLDENLKLKRQPYGHFQAMLPKIRFRFKKRLQKE
jgi:cytochrome P450